MTPEERKAIIDGIHGIEIVEGGGVWIKRLPLDLLADAKENPRRIKKANRKALDGMLAEFGLVDVLQYNLRTGELVGGHQRIDWLRRSGVTEVAVAILDLDQTRQRALNIGLNNPRAQGAFTADVTGILAQISPVMPKLYQDTGLAALVSRATVDAHTRTRLNVDDDDDDDIDQDLVCEPGDVFDLGGSRLVIGDSFVDDTADLTISGQRITAIVGSSRALIAAHALGRRCAILEKDPGRGAVIITRFARKFGIRPIRITRAPFA